MSSKERKGIIVKHRDNPNNELSWWRVVCTGCFRWSGDLIEPGVVIAGEKLKLDEGSALAAARNHLRPYRREGILRGNCTVVMSEHFPNHISNQSNQTSTGINPSVIL